MISRSLSCALMGLTNTRNIPSYQDATAQFAICVNAAKTWLGKQSPHVNSAKTTVTWNESDLVGISLPEWCTTADGKRHISCEISSWRGIALLANSTKRGLIGVFSGFPSVTAAIHHHVRDFIADNTVRDYYAEAMQIDLIILARDLPEVSLYAFQYINHYDQAITVSAGNTYFSWEDMRSRESRNITSISFTLEKTAVKVSSDLTVEIEGKQATSQSALRTLEILAKHILPLASPVQWDEDYVEEEVEADHARL